MSVGPAEEHNKLPLEIDCVLHWWQVGVGGIKALGQARAPMTMHEILQVSSSSFTVPLMLQHTPNSLHPDLEPSIPWGHLCLHASDDILAQK